MSTSREPKLLLIALMVGIALISAPWYGEVASMDPMIWGAPRWAIIQMVSYLGIFCLGLLASVLWKPPRENTSVERKQETKEITTGVAPSEAETAATQETSSKM